MFFLNSIKDKIKYSKYTHRNIINMIRYPYHFISSYLVENDYGSIGVIMCVWDEEDNILNALQSSFKYVDKYYIIDKNGRMKKYVDRFFSHCGVPYYYEIKEDLNLLDSRKYALSIIKEDWILIQDGDEIVLYPHMLKYLTKVKYICYQTRLKINADLIQPYHCFFYPNDSLIYFERNRDIPRYKSRYKRLSIIMKENRKFNKNEKRLLYRNKYWLEYQYSGFIGNIEEYVKIKGYEKYIDPQILIKK